MQNIIPSLNSKHNLLDYKGKVEKNSPQRHDHEKCRDQQSHRNER